MRHEDRIRQLLGQKPDVGADEFDSGCLPAALYLFAVLFLGVVVDLCAIK